MIILRYTSRSYARQCQIFATTSVTQTDTGCIAISAHYAHVCSHYDQPTPIPSCKWQKVYIMPIFDCPATVGPSFGS